MTDIFLAMSTSLEYIAQWPHDEKPLNLLASFAFKPLMEGALDRFRPARLMLDSGAYSAWSVGKSIDMDALLKEGAHPRYTDTVALDVIGDPEASVKNAFKMKAAGSKAFPVFHYGDPWEHLAIYREHFGRVGLSCRFGEPYARSYAWLEQCFARGWPCRFHSFGWTSFAVLGRFPFDSADSSAWINGFKYGAVKFMGQRDKNNPVGRLMHPTVTLPRASGRMTATPEIQSVWTTQAFLRTKWAKQLKEARAR